MGAGGVTIYLARSDIEAVQWFKDIDHPAVKCIDGVHYVQHCVDMDGSGLADIEEGDWVVKDGDGTFHPCKDDLFLSLYCNARDVGISPPDDDYHKAKHDKGKPIAGALVEFRHALMAVADLLTYGAGVYGRGCWPDVPDGEARYRDAMWRHELAPGTTDPESGLHHDVHRLFNDLANVELRLRREAKERSDGQEELSEGEKE